MEFIEAPAFTRHLVDYLDEEAYRMLQMRLAENPAAGDLIQGTGGFRKLRWADARRNKGRRGGLRIIYFFFASEQQVWLMTIYDKSEAADLSANEKKALRTAIGEELRARSQQLARGAAKRRS